MSDEIIREVIAKVEEMVKEGEKFEDATLQDFAVTIDHLLKQLSRKEEVLAMASAMLALDEYKKSLNKLVEYAKVGDLKEREATLLEILDQLDKELDMAVTMKIHEHTYRENIADDIRRAVLDHLAPTLGRGKWHAREEAIILEIISKVMEGYLVVKVDREA